MKKLNDISLIYTLTLPLIVLFIMLVVSLFVMRYFTNDNYLVAGMQLVEKSNGLIREIVLDTERYMEDNTEVISSLESATESYESNLKLMKEGGNFAHFGAMHGIIDEDIRPAYTELQKHWLAMKANIETVVKQPFTIMETQTEQIGVDTLGRPITSTTQIEVPNPDVVAAKENLHLLADKIIKQHQNIQTGLAQKENAQKNRNTLYLLIILIVNLFAIIYSVFLAKKIIVSPVRNVEKATTQLAKGNLSHQIPFSSDNEIGHISKAINYLREKLLLKVEFIREVSKGNYNSEYQIENDSDEMGKSLLEMRESFQRAAEEEEKRKIEDEKQNWATQGITQLSDVLRQNNDNIDALSYNIISFLVSYLNANQGGVFVVNDDKQDDVYIELTASVAYNKRKFLNKRIETGEGVVGRCIQEELTIYMTDLPDDYLDITSGLGKAVPKNLLVVPLKFNNQILGVVEIASFHQFEKYQIEFVEQAAESIASTISTVKINTKTANLLRESQEQAEERNRQEAELREKMEELSKAQQEARVQEEKLASFTDSVNHTMIRAEYSTDGRLVYANTRFLELLNYNSYAEIENRHISMFIDQKDRQWFNTMWEPLSRGGKHYEGNMKHKTKDGRDLWMMATYTAVRDAQGNPLKILFLAIDTTDQKMEDLNNKGIIQALEESSLKAEYLPSGRVLKANKLFTEKMLYSEAQLENKTIFDFIKKEDLAEFKVHWDNAIDDISFKGEMRHITRSNEEIWLHVTLSAVKDMYDEVAKVVFIGNDITEQKQIELLAHEQEQEIRKNLTKLEAAQKETENQQKKLQEVNNRLQANEDVLKKALEKSQEKEKELQEKGSALAASEEELRQNMEELQATQEDMMQKQADMEALIYAVDNSLVSVELNADATVRRFNSNFESLFEIDIEEMENQNFEVFIDNGEHFQQVFKKVLKGESHTEELTVTNRKNKQFWLLASYTPVKDKNQNVSKVYFLAQDITHNKLLELKAKEQSDHLKAAEEELRHNLEELQATQEDMQRKQIDLEQNNKKMLRNEKILEKALKRAKDKEQQLQEKSAQLNENEKILKEKMQELEEKTAEMEKVNERLEKNESVITKALQLSKRRENELKERTQELTASEEELRQNMEELKATQDQIEKQKDELEKRNTKMKKNEAVMQKILTNSKQKEKTLKQQIEELKQEIKQLKEGKDK